MWGPVLHLTQVALLAVGPSSATADDIIAQYVKRIGGMEKIQAVTTLRRTGKFTSPSGREAIVVRENKRPGKVREEYSLQGMTEINAYDGATGWKVAPFQGKKEPEALSEEEMKVIVEDSDFDDPLIRYQEKGNKVEPLGKDDVEGTDTYKLKVTLKNGDVRYYFMDAESYVPIKIETQRMIRGAEQEFETWLGDYKEVAGWYLPYAVESGVKGSDNRSKITYDKIEANVSIDDRRFEQPGTPPGKASPPPAPHSGNTPLHHED